MPFAGVQGCPVKVVEEYKGAIAVARPGIIILTIIDVDERDIRALWYAADLYPYGGRIVVKGLDPVAEKGAGGILKPYVIRPARGIPVQVKVRPVVFARASMDGELHLVIREDPIRAADDLMGLHI